MKYLIWIMSLMLLTATGCVDKTGNPPETTFDIIPFNELPSPDQFVPVEQAPVMTHEATPVYPILAYASGIEARLFIQAFIDAEGRVRHARSIACDQPGWDFEDAAVDAAYRCRFEPARQNGKPIGVWITYKVSFVIGE